MIVRSIEKEQDRKSSKRRGSTRDESDEDDIEMKKDLKKRMPRKRKQNEVSVKVE